MLIAALGAGFAALSGVEGRSALGAWLKLRAVRTFVSLAASMLTAEEIVGDRVEFPLMVVLHMSPILSNC